ncbi:HU family DNA-binding protein [Shewanella sp. 202IG2-18]|uniref:HU family DNA-binding protein n=1 Tax=Parashewanella hymeniacidonis TaxID=2807618 RepID=UPI00195F60FB|nr:HU family DNA-binding protein [Parashewanella hymeniacidonis]MBM7071130.1 HU family DNA-binding protein [Parashewanella hymeniacidonis]
MNKSELVKAMAELSETTQKDTKSALNSLLKMLHQALSEGEKVFLPQFGTFELRYHLPKQGRNPQTGESIEIEGYNQPSFKFSANVKQVIND